MPSLVNGNPSLRTEYSGKDRNCYEFKSSLKIARDDMLEDELPGPAPPSLKHFVVTQKRTEGGSVLREGWDVSPSGV